jgi:hypothetical protein
MLRDGLGRDVSKTAAAASSARPIFATLRDCPGFLAVADGHADAALGTADHLLRIELRATTRNQTNAQ